MVSPLKLIESQCEQKKLQYLDYKQKRSRQLRNRLSQSLMDQQASYLDLKNSFDRRDRVLERKCENLNSRHSFYTEGVREYQQRKEQAAKVREELYALKSAYYQRDAVARDAVYESNKKALKEGSQRWLKDKKLREEVKAEEATLRRKSIESIKSQQLSYLNSVFQDQLAQVLQNKVQIDNSRKEHFTRKVKLHDLEIQHRRMEAEEARVDISLFSELDKKSLKSNWHPKTKPERILLGIEKWCFQI